MKTYNTLLTDLDEDGVLTITLNRPDLLNAFSVEMAHELPAALDEADATDAVRAVIVTGAGKGFCAGMDLQPGENISGLDDSIDPMGAEAEKIRDLGGFTTLRLFRMKKPVIAAVNGPAVGVGATMTLAMDARILSKKARIGFVFARVGIVLESCASWFLPRIVGMEKALEWSMTAEVIDAETAYKAGFGGALVEPEDVLPAAKSLARRMAAAGLSPVSIGLNRQLLWRMAGASHPMEAHRMESRLLHELFQDTAPEGIAAFQEKRLPDFKRKVSDGPLRALDWDGEPGFLDD